MQDQIKKLIDGNKVFRQKYFQENNELFNSLLEQGQRPKVMVIACSDSRIDPALMFNCEPGQLFVIRNVANLVPPCEQNDSSYHGVSAALQFGACILEVEHIIVLGHSNCGGIQTLVLNHNNIFDKEKYNFISKWLELAKPALELVLKNDSQVSTEQQIINCEHYSLINSLNNLLTFCWIKKRVNANKLMLHSWYFDLLTGKVEAYDKATNAWK